MPTTSPLNYQSGAPGAQNLYKDMTSLYNEGNENAAIALYNLAKTQYGFTDEQFSPFALNPNTNTPFSAQHIANWANTQPTPVQQQPAPQQPATPSPTTGNYLTLSDLSNWWTGTAQPWMQQQWGKGQMSGGGDQSNGLSALYPRQNWGNYQTSNRGGRYFNPTTGNYQGLQQAQTASL